MASIKRTLLVLAGLLVLPPAQAELITYTFTAEVRGVLLPDETSTTDVAGLMTVKIEGNTADVSSRTLAGYDIVIWSVSAGLTNTINIKNSLGTDLLSDSIVVVGGLFVSNSQSPNSQIPKEGTGVVAFGSNAGGTVEAPPFDMLTLGPSSELATYELRTNFNKLPLDVDPNDLPGFKDVPLASGAVLSLVFATNGTFQAVTTAAAVPEPGTLVLFGAALASIGLARRRRLA